MAVKILTSIFLPSLLVISGASHAVEPSQSQYTKEKINKLVKKYPSTKVKEALILNDSLSAQSANSIDNEWFTISYPKCFKAEPTLEDSDDVTIYNSASLNFSATKTCTDFIYDESPLIVGYRHRATGKSVERFATFLPSAPEVKYSQFVSVGDARGVFAVRLEASMNPEAMYQPLVRWDFEVICKGKNNEVFNFYFISHRGKSAIAFLEKGNFEIPAGYKQIISSFKCRKDR